MKAFDRRGLTGQGLALDLKMEGLHFTLMSAMRLLHPMIFTLGLTLFDLP